VRIDIGGALLIWVTPAKTLIRKAMRSARARDELIELMRPVMPRLSHACGFGVTLGSLIEDKVTILEIIAGKNQLDFAVKSGGRLDLRTSAHGLVALAFGPKDLLAAQSGTGEVETLCNRVAKIRQDGWATAIDSVEYWANALAAPVFDAKGVWRGSCDGWPISGHASQTDQGAGAMD